MAAQETEGTIPRNAATANAATANAATANAAQSENSSPANGKAARAVAFFTSGYNCGQSSMAPFAADFGLDEAFVLKAASGFGGGMGGCRITCGAVSAMAFYAGLTLGDYAPDDLESKTRLYAKIKEMVAAFTAEFGTTECRALLLNAGIDPKPDPSARTAEYYADRPCAKFIAKAAELIQTHLLDSRSENAGT